MGRSRLPFPECLALFSLFGLFGGVFGYAFDLPMLKPFLALCSTLAFLSFFFFRAKSYGIGYPERIGFLGFLGALGFLGVIPGLRFLAGLSGLSGLFAFYFFFFRRFYRRT
jgi:hypothetical protein